MNPRIKLLTPWFGPLPGWYDKFKERMDANSIVCWELLMVHNVDWVNHQVEGTVGAPCKKATPYSTCDLRPFFGVMFAERFTGYDFWGWCDLDICVGDLDVLLPELLEAHDIIRLDGGGPMTIIRNEHKFNTLYQDTDYKAILRNPDYLNFDEDGFGPDNANDNFERILQNSGFQVAPRVVHDGRTWSEKRDMLEGGIPSRCCELKDGKLFEVPTGRELLFYHFTSKEWPLPNRYRSHVGAQRDRWNNPTTKAGVQESPEFWAERLKEVLVNRAPLHLTSYNTTFEDWRRIQQHSVAVIQKLVQPDEKLLDCGCGIGLLFEALMARGCSNYVGVDYCAPMIEFTKRRKRPYRNQFVVGDLRKLPFADDSFDWAFCRGVEGSVRTLLSNDDWAAMQKEMLRVARRLIVVNLNCEHRVIERSNR